MQVFDKEIVIPSANFFISLLLLLTNKSKSRKYRTITEDIPQNAGQVLVALTQLLLFGFPLLLQNQFSPKSAVQIDHEQWVARQE